MYKSSCNYRQNYKINEYLPDLYLQSAELAFLFFYGIPVRLFREQYLDDFLK